MCCCCCCCWSSCAIIAMNLILFELFWPSHRPRIGTQQTTIANNHNLLYQQLSCQQLVARPDAQCCFDALNVEQHPFLYGQSQKGARKEPERSQKEAKEWSVGRRINIRLRMFTYNLLETHRPDDASHSYVTGQESRLTIIKLSRHCSSSLCVCVVCIEIHQLPLTAD